MHAALSRCSSVCSMPHGKPLLWLSFRNLFVPFLLVGTSLPNLSRAFCEKPRRTCLNVSCQQCMARFERRVLANVTYYDDYCITHTDEKYMAKQYDIKPDQRDNYFIRTYPSQVCAHVCALRVCVCTRVSACVYVCPRTPYSPAVVHVYTCIGGED